MMRSLTKGQSLTLQPNQLHNGLEVCHTRPAARRDFTVKGVQTVAWIKTSWNHALFEVDPSSWHKHLKVIMMLVMMVFEGDQ